MKRCGAARLHMPHDDCDGGSDYVESFDDQDVDFERGMYFEQDDDDCARMSATERNMRPENA